MPIRNCPKCKGKGYFKEYNVLTGNILKIPCLCIPKELKNHPIFIKEIAIIQAKQELVKLKENNNDERN